MSEPLRACSFDAFKPVTGITGRCIVRGEHDVHEDECGNRWRHDEEWNRHTLSRTRPRDLHDPTSDGDAVGYLMQQAAAVGPQNSRERELSEKCAEYLRAVVDRAR